jgi:hypothetical protein
VLCVREFRDFNIFSWVQISTLQLGAQGGERNRDLQAESVDRIIGFHQQVQKE